MNDNSSVVSVPDGSADKSGRAAQQGVDIVVYFCDKSGIHLTLGNLRFYSIRL